MATPTTTDPQPGVRVLTIDEAAEEARCSRSTVERALAAYRENPATGLKHYRRAPLNLGRRRKSAKPRGRVYIQPGDLDRWMKGLPPEPDEAGGRKGSRARATSAASPCPRT